MATEYAKDQPEDFSNRIERVALIGAGGRMGQYLAKYLLQTGKHTVTAITRPDSTNKLPNGVKVAKVDYSGDDNTALVEALKGQQVLLITMAVTAPRDTMGKLVDAAAKAGVRYILPNWFGHDSNNDSLCQDIYLKPILDAVTAQVKSLGVSSYLLLNCGFWYEFSLGGGPDRYGFDFQTRSFTWFDDGNTPINTTTWDQCGRAIASALSLKELPEDASDKSTTLSQFRNMGLYISSFRLTQREMFDSVKRVTKTSDSDWKISHESSEVRWKEGTDALQKGDFKLFTKMLYSRTWFPNGGGDFESAHGLDNKALGLPTEDLDKATAEGIRMGEANEVPYSH